MDENLTDDPSRAPQRASWDALSLAEQLAVVGAATSPAGWAGDARAWSAGLPCGRPLVGAVVCVLGAHSPQGWR